MVIKTKDKELSRKHRGRHFQIQYSLISNSYKIKDLGVGFGAYVRIDEPLVLKDNYLITMGESFFIINLVSNNPADNNQSEKNKLKIKVFAGPANGEMLYYYIKNI